MRLRLRLDVIVQSECECAMCMGYISICVYSRMLLLCYLKKGVSHTTELFFVWKDQRQRLHFAFFVFCFCFALLYIIYKDLYIYFTFAFRVTCAMRNVPAGTSRLRKTLTMPDRQALLMEAQAINNKPMCNRCWHKIQGLALALFLFRLHKTKR